MNCCNSMWVFRAAILSALAISVAGCGKREIPDGTVVSILYTSDVRGKIEGCGCKHNGGGITKRSAKILAARAEDPSVLYCDAGNFLTGTAEVDSTKGALSVAVYNALGAGVVNVSERELAFGVNEFKSAESESKFKYVSANLTEGGASLADQYVIIPIKEANVAFFGLCGTRETMRYDSLRMPSSVMIEEPIVAARRVVNELTGKADLIVLLSTCGDAVDSAIAQALPQINLVIGGRSYRPNSEVPWVIGDTRVVRAQRDGRTLGRMDMVFGPDRKIKMYNPTSVTMETGDPSDEKMLTVVRKYIPAFVDNPTDGVRIAASNGSVSATSDR